MRNQLLNTMSKEARQLSDTLASVCRSSTGENREEARLDVEELACVAKLASCKEIRDTAMTGLHYALGARNKEARRAATESIKELSAARS